MVVLTRATTSESLYSARVPEYEGSEVVTCYHYNPPVL